MTAVEYTANYVTQAQLRLAYQRLDHRPKRPSGWSATLLIDKNLNLSWACPVITAEEMDEYPAIIGWHVIAEVGELDWPPLRPEDEIWPALLEKHPIPTGEHAEMEARVWGNGSVEELHREQLRRHYLSDAHIGSLKRNPTDVSFDPIVRDWDVTARELAEFIDSHRPPKLTSEQKVMAQGVHRVRLINELRNTEASLARLMRNAAREQGDRLRLGFKTDLSLWTGLSRPTVNVWLKDSACCEGAVPDEDGTLHSGHTHTSTDDEDLADLPTKH